MCNNCSEKKLCSKDKYIYSAKYADAAVTRRRSECRQGIRISDEKKSEMDELITRLVKKGQPLTHIYAEHENEIPVCLRTLYNYIDDGEMPVKNIDLRRKTGYKKRGKGHQPSLGFANVEFRQGRTYTDFEYAMKAKYAVGCMFGRYSLDADGLAYAGGEWDASKYTSFVADKDNIIPICDDEYFEDDIVGLFVEFVKTVYGADTLDENLKFIADALGGKGQPKDVIRNYFLRDFYSDHCKIYQKRPIYWLFDSGKKNGFKALIYMHRYQPDTIARIRTDYVHEQQARYRTVIADLEQRIANASTGERVKLNKKLTILQAQDTEIRTYEEKIHHLADQMISIDLDDGVKKNYAIFQDVLKKI